MSPESGFVFSFCLGGGPSLPTLPPRTGQGLYVERWPK